MELLHVILWMIYPYSVVAIIGMGIVWQYDMTKVLDDSETELKSNLVLRKAVASLVSLSIVTGIAVLIISNDPEYLFQWFLSLLRLQPDVNLIMNISILSQVHLLLVLTLLVFVSFTKYLSYIFNPHRFIKGRIVKIINKL